MAKEFKMPDFMEGNDPAEIQLRMMEQLPDDIDTMPGGFPYDFTMPTAIVKSELIQYYGMRILMMMFPQYAWGEWLDLHGEQVKVYRKGAAHAGGNIKVYGTAETIIREGTTFCTPVYEDGISFDFKAVRDVKIEEDGTVLVPVISVNGGEIYNVGKGAITLLPKPITGVASVINEEKMTGGTDPESDEELYKRIKMEYDGEGSSFVGNDRDYIRWATSVDGVKDCIVIPTYNGPGTVKLIIVGEDSEVNETMLEGVRKKILGENRSDRLLPAGCAELLVTGPEWVELHYVITDVVFESSITSVEKVAEDFYELLENYYKTGKEKGQLSYNQIRSLITQIEGVSDYGNFTMNGAQDNITLNQEEFPKTVSATINQHTGGGK